MQIITALITALFLIVCAPAMSAEIVINAVGDIMLAGNWSAQLKKQGYDYAFRGVAAELANGDVTLANLETPVARGGVEFTEKKFRFRAEPEVARALKNARINVVTLANNHIMDFGGEALSETILNLDHEGIAHCGAGENIAAARKAVIMSAQGKKVAFLGYSLTQPTEFFAGAARPGTAPGLATYFESDIRKARTDADFVIVSFHWGTEGKSDVQDYQQVVAHKAINAGADVIIGHHPHVLRGIERYKKGIIFYSLGNFVFASKSTTADTSAIIRLRLDDTRREAEIIPLDILYRRVGFQPQTVSRERAFEIIHKLNVLSKPFGTTIEQQGGKYVVVF